jgi:NADH dehydrogenase
MTNRIVLLGSTGFVGHHLLPALASAGHHCVALTRYPQGCRELAVTPGVEIHQANIFDRSQLNAFFTGADAVINMAGILNESGRKGKGFNRVHVELVANAISACEETGVKRFVQVSALNAGKGSSHYLASKGRAEGLLRSAEGLDTTIFQPSVIFGDGDGFFNRFAALLKALPVMPLACPKAKMQPVWVGDVAAAITRSIADPGTFGKTLVLVGPEVYSLKELVEYTAEVAGLKRKIIGLPDSLSRLQGYLMDFVPGKPFSSDNFLSLQIENTSAQNSLPSLGIQARSLKSVVPGYLARSWHQQRLDESRKRKGH